MSALAAAASLAAKGAGASEVLDKVRANQASMLKGAVGSAVACNPIAVLIPCHRVIRKLGEFGQYRYGAARKKALLGREHFSTQL